MRTTLAAGPAPPVILITSRPPDTLGFLPLSTTARRHVGETTNDPSVRCPACGRSGRLAMVAWRAARLAGQPPPTPTSGGLPTAAEPACASLFQRALIRVTGPSRRCSHSRRMLSCPEASLPGPVRSKPAGRYPALRIASQYLLRRESVAKWPQRQPTHWLLLATPAGVKNNPSMLQRTVGIKRSHCRKRQATVRCGGGRSTWPAPLSRRCNTCGNRRFSAPGAAPNHFGNVAIRPGGPPIILATLGSARVGLQSFWQRRDRPGSASNHFGNVAIRPGGPPIILATWRSARVAPQSFWQHQGPPGSASNHFGNVGIGPRRPPIILATWRSARVGPQSFWQHQGPPGSAAQRSRHRAEDRLPSPLKLRWPARKPLGTAISGGWTPSARRLPPRRGCRGRVHAWGSAGSRGTLRRIPASSGRSGPSADGDPR